MDVIVDGASFSVEPELETIVEAVASVNDALRARKRAVVAVKVDGALVQPADFFAGAADRPVSEVGRIEVESDDVSALVDQSLRELEEHVPELPAVCHGLAAVFQGARPEDGFEPFVRLARVWEEIKRREAMIVSALDLPLDELTVDGAPLAKLLKDLNDFLHEAADALEANDCVTLGDLLEYELAPRAAIEADIVAFLRERAEQRSG